VVSAVLFFAFAAKAETTNGLSEAEIKGRELAQRLCDSRPEGNLTNTGVLQIRNDKGKRLELPITIQTIVTSTNWLNRYAAKFGSNTTDVTTLVISHDDADSSRYLLFENDKTAELSIAFHFHVGMGVSGDRIIIPFAHSDFWLCDLGLDFFHWPVQKVLPNTTRLKRGRAYTLLESTNPNPPTNGYSRVLSWIDVESGGILEAEAYDAQGKLLKVFEPKSFKKVNGQWELQEMEIRNVQTGSRTRLEFDLKK
jgi:hypothetical protein